MALQIEYRRPEELAPYAKNSRTHSGKQIAQIEASIREFGFTNPLLIDEHGGSGSTLIACEKTDRRARLVELDPKFCDVIVKRWQSLTEQHAVHKASGKTFEELSNNGKKKTK